MILRYEYLSTKPAVFQSMTGLTIRLFDELTVDLEPCYQAAEWARLDRPDRQRTIGGGREIELPLRDQLLLTVVWLRCYPKQQVLGYLFAVSEATVSRTLARIVPLLEAAGRDTMRMPDPGRKQRRELDELLQQTPELAVIIDTFEQKVQRHRDPQEADRSYSGKKKHHTLKVQVAMDEQTGRIVELAPRVPGPTADLKLLEQSGLLARLPAGVGALGDLAYVGIAQLHPSGAGATPRRKPRGKARPPEDIAFNTAFARRRVVVEHAINRLRRFEALSQTDRHHRRQHTARTLAVAGLVNRRLDARLPRAA